MASSIFVWPGMFSSNGSNISFAIGQSATIEIDGIATTSTTGFTIQNTAASTVGVTVQYSPRLVLAGTAWNSVGAASEIDAWSIEVQPATAAGATSALLSFSNSIAGGAFTQRVVFGNSGSLQLATGASFLWSGRARLTDGGSDAQVNITNNAGTSGFGLDASTDGTCKIRNRAQTAGTGNLDLGAKLTSYNGISTAGWGVPSIQAAGRTVAATNATVASVAAYTVGAADGSFYISANVNVTATTAAAMTVTCVYTDETNTSRTLTLGFTQLSGATLLTSITNVTGTGPYESIPYHIRCKAATSITIATAGTVTGITYNVEGFISQVS